LPHARGLSKESPTSGQASVQACSTNQAHNEGWPPHCCCEMRLKTPPSRRHGTLAIRRLLVPVMLLILYILLVNITTTPQDPPPLIIITQPFTEEDPTYRIELDSLVNDGGGAPLLNRFNKKVEPSLLLLTRRGHRRRVLDLIGSTYPDASLVEQRRRLALLPPTSFSSRAPHVRDYQTHPVRIRTPLTNSPCPLPCAQCPSVQPLIVGRIDHPFGIGSKTINDMCDTVEERLTMENYPCSLVFDTFNLSRQELATPIYGSTRLESDVPLPYFSWADFGLMKPITDREPRPELAAAFISNCGSKLRNQVLAGLLAHSQGRIRSYGKCQHTHDEPKTSDRVQSKLSHLSKYKFSLAFENSRTKDYVSEKFWQSLIMGTVPVVIGAPNIKFYAPDTGPFPYQTKALIDVADYEFNSTALTQALLELDTNHDKYKEMVAWKTTGYSDDFKAFADLASSTHSSCRVCILAADRRRRALGPSTYDLRVLHSVNMGAENDDDDDRGYQYYIRERGQYAFTWIKFPSLPSMVELIASVLNHVTPINKPLYLDNQDLREFRDSPRVYAFYTLQPRLAVLTDKDLEVLPRQGVELEVIFV
jgi:hypothetical protein